MQGGHPQWYRLLCKDGLAGCKGTVVSWEKEGGGWQPPLQISDRAADEIEAAERGQGSQDGQAPTVPYAVEGQIQVAQERCAALGRHPVDAVVLQVEGP